MDQGLKFIFQTYLIQEPSTLHAWTFTTLLFISPAKRVCRSIRWNSWAIYLCQIVRFEILSWNSVGDFGFYTGSTSHFGPCSPCHIQFSSKLLINFKWGDFRSFYYLKRSAVWKYEHVNWKNVQNAALSRLFFSKNLAWLHLYFWTTPKIIISWTWVRKNTLKTVKKDFV